MLAEFPALAELMALSVTAGESAVGALERVVRSSRGELSKEFRSILSMTRSGEPLVSALQSFSQRTSVAALSRFVDGLVVAIERGTPLADVLRAQAQDVRDNAKRELMETAGKKEIGMMAPVVFLILPLTVLFAMFPGISLLNLNF
ncbi:type II secretion system F family protein [Rothia nasimurium]|nr:type II secretion system F family protein [Rothia nasimurium]